MDVAACAAAAAASNRRQNEHRHRRGCQHATDPEYGDPFHHLHTGARPEKDRQPQLAFLSDRSVVIGKL